MPDSFDPYHQWLGIPAKDQPPNHYRLLGLEDFENNPSVIEAAADRQMGHVRTYQAGQHSQLSQKVLNQIAAARVVLLNPDKKAEYDASLRAKAVPVVSPTLPPVRKRSNLNPTILAGAGVVAALLVAIIIFATSGSDEPTQPAVATAKPITIDPPPPPVVPEPVKVEPEPVIEPGPQPESQPQVQPEPKPAPEPSQPTRGEDSLADLLDKAKPEPAPEVQKYSGTYTPHKVQEYKGHKYQLVEAPGISWAQAKDACEKVGGHLVYTETWEELQFVGAYKGRKEVVVWAGGQRHKDEEFHWLNGKPVDCWKGHEGRLWGSERKQFSFVSIGNKGMLTCRPGDGKAVAPGSNSSLAVDVAGYVCEWDAEVKQEPTPQQVVEPEPKTTPETTPERSLGDLLDQPEETTNEVADAQGQMKSVHLADLKHTSFTGHRSAKDVFTKRGRSIMAHPHPITRAGDITYDLNGKYDIIVGDVGLNSNLARSPQSFAIIGDGKELWASSHIQPRSGKIESFRINITGVNTLTLRTQCHGNPFAADDIWIEPQLLILPKERQTPPDEVAIAEAVTTIHDVYKNEYAAQNKTPLVKLLLARGREAVKDPASQFAFLSEARDVAMSAGDYKAAFEAIEDLGHTFKVDAIAMKMEVLRAAVPNPQYQEAIVAEAMNLATEAANQGDEKTVEQLGRMAYSAARRLRNVEQVKQVVAFNQTTKEWGEFVSKAKLAIEALEDRPDDPAVNSWAGKYYCLVEGDWEKGLPLLVKGSPDSLRAVVVQDVASPTTTDDQVALADAWWELGETVEGVFAERLQARAAYWYKQAQPNATGITKDKIEKRLEGAK